MFEVSWGELLVLGVVGAAVTGRKDLPLAFRFVGSQVGRVVGILQGARARADAFAAQHELKQLQNELRSGLRELDQVRMELAVAASSQGIMGRTLGTTTDSANRLLLNNRPMQQLVQPQNQSLAVNRGTSDPSSTFSSLSSTSISNSGSTLNSISTSIDSQSSNPKMSLGQIIPTQPTDTLITSPNIKSSLGLRSTTANSELSLLEVEWEKQGIGFTTRAEQIQKSQSAATGNPSGSELLANLIKQELAWDQYDKVVGEQEAQLQERIATIKQKRVAQNDLAAVVSSSKAESPRSENF